MKIGIFTPYLNSLTGGEKYILSCASCLSKNHEVFLFWNPQDEQEIKKNAMAKFGIGLERVTFARNIFNKKTSFFKRLLETKQYDRILFLSDGSIPFVLSKLILHFQFPVEWVDGKSFKSRLKFSRVASVICNSEFTKTFIDKSFNIKSSVLYPPCDTSIIPKKKEKIILHIGRFGMSLEGTNFKKQDVMIEVFKDMVDKGLLGWKFVLIMSVMEQDREKIAGLQKLAKGYPIEFIINAEKSVVSSNIASAKIYWHASGFGEDLQNHPERAEHFGIATVEAMAGGCVPVVINAGGQREIVESGKNGFTWDTKDELASYTSKLMKDDGLWNTLSKNAASSALKFSKDVFCEKLMKIL